MDSFIFDDIPNFFSNFSEIITIQGYSLVGQMQTPSQTKEGEGAFFDFDFILFLKTNDIETYKIPIFPNRVLNINSRLFYVVDRKDNLGISEIKLKKNESL